MRESLQLPARFSEQAIERWLKVYFVLMVLGIGAFFSQIDHVRLGASGYWMVFKGLLFVGLPSVFTATSHLLLSRNVFRGLVLNLAISAVFLAVMWALALQNGWLQTLSGLVGKMLGVYLSANMLAGALIGTVLYVVNPRERWIFLLTAATALLVTWRIVS